MDPEKCKVLIFENVHRFYASLNLKVDEDIPILLVDKDEMIKFKNKKTETIPTGIAMYNYYKPIMTINRCTKYEDRIKVEKKANKVTKLQLLPAFCCGQREMIRLLLRFGWPDVIMGMTLAHEMMHAWLRFQGLIGCFKLERWLEEGICQVMSHKYGEWYFSRGVDYSYKTKEQLDITNKLYPYRAELLRNHSDEIYREGFNQ
ncbi:protein DA1-like, partial [Prunus avium]|uniref:Protein DA1-like n=1 Tax=Prunus avium TaxID=42229 RepID=A0A6P5RQS4_PRUAV